MLFVSTKTYNQIGPVAYRQWRAESHCKHIHGYALSFYFEFEAHDLDSRNWVVDFGSLTQLKGLLEDWFDHTLLVAEDDPEFDAMMHLEEIGIAKCTVVERTGCEGIAAFLYEYINEQYLPTYGYGKRVWCSKVQVRETDANMAMVKGHRPIETDHNGYVI